MTARTSYNILQKITQDLKRRTVPTLPPAPGCEGDDDYQQQVTIWQNWVEWEKEDPLVLKEEDIKAYRDRVLYVYRQATMALTQHRLDVVLGAKNEADKVRTQPEQLEKIYEQAEAQIDAGQLEQVLEQAQAEYKLAAKMVDWKA